MARFAVVLALALPLGVSPEVALAHTPTPQEQGGDHLSKKQRCMKNKKCRDRRHRIHQVFRFCNTWACVKRVKAVRAKREAARAKRYDNMRIRFTRPYRAWLYSTRMCESGGNYSTNTGNGFYGAYQFVLSTWHSVGGWGYPHQNEPLEQDYRAVILLKRSGPGQWPVCG